MIFIYRKLKNDIELIYNSPGGKEAKEICRVCNHPKSYMEVKAENYDVYIRPCVEGDIIEIDTFNELKAIDKVYDC